MPRNLRRSVLHNKNKSKKNKTRRYKFRGGQSQEETKSHEREIYDKYVGKFVSVYIPANDRERFFNLSNAYKDAKIELLMLPKDPMFKNKDLIEKARSIRNVLYKSSSGSVQPTQQIKQKPRQQNVGYQSKLGNNVGMTSTDVNAGIALASNFDDMCTIL
jgi:hypothetical protein